MVLAALSKQALGYRLLNDWLLLLSIDLDAFCDIWSTRGFCLSPFESLSSSCVFSLPLPWLPTTPINQPYVSTCGIDEKITMAGSLRINELKYLWWLYNGKGLCGSSFMHSWDIVHWIIELHISKYLFLCITGSFPKSNHS